MSWQPNQAGAEQIVNLLTEFQKPGADQHQVIAQLEQCKAIPDFNNYLAFIFAFGEGLPIEVRQSAGLLLKNNMKASNPFSDTAQQPVLQPQNLLYVRDAILRAVGYPERTLRHTAGTCLVWCVGASIAASSPWPELTAALAQYLDSGDSQQIDGALDCHYKLWEELPLALEGDRALRDATGRAPSEELLPRTLSQFSAGDAEIRKAAVTTLNLAAGYRPVALQALVDSYVQGLFTLAHDQSSSVRQAVCNGLVLLLSLVPEKMQNNMGEIIEYMMVSMQDADEEVVVNASEFWGALADSKFDVTGVLRPFLPRLVPMLLTNMAYDEFDDEVAEAEQAEEEALSGATNDTKDSADLKPHFRSSTAHNADAPNGTANGATEDDDDDDEDVGSNWNKRRAAASALDRLSNEFNDELLPLLLPEVQQRLGLSDWRMREAAILVLGAVAHGCGTGMVSQLPAVVAAVAPFLKDPRPMVRSMSSWTLARYTRWLIQRAGEGAGQELDVVVKGICELVATDRNRRVQIMSCSALAIAVEEFEAGSPAALQYGPLVLSALGAALQSYGRRSMRSLLDTIEVACDAFSTTLRTPEGAAMVLPHLFGRLQSVPDGDTDLIIVMDCLGRVAQSAGPQLEPYAEVSFHRCVNVADRALAAAASGAYDDQEEADQFVSSALDAISGLTEGLGPGVESLVARSALVDILVACCQAENPDLRLSAFALVGDLAKMCPPHLQSHLKNICAAALTNLDLPAITQANMGACNNAAWALGELAAVCPPEVMTHFAVPLLERALPVLSAPTGAVPRSLVENCAIVLGRFAWTCGDALAPHANSFVPPLCAALRSVRDGLEKEHAFLGLTNVLKRNPGAGLQAFPSLCDAVVSWRRLTSEGLRQELIALMRAYKEQLTSMGQWDAAMGSLQPAVRQKLIEMCQL